MKKYNKTAIVITDICVDDHIKVAGVLYRITQVEQLGRHYILEFRNVRRPKMHGVLTLPEGTLMFIYNQK